MQTCITITWQFCFFYAVYSINCWTELKTKLVVTLSKSAWLARYLARSSCLVDWLLNWCIYAPQMFYHKTGFTSHNWTGYFHFALHVCLFSKVFTGKEKLLTINTKRFLWNGRHSWYCTMYCLEQMTVTTNWCHQSWKCWRFWWLASERTPFRISE